ncbi:MAG: hypothetical protein ACRDSJ_22375 [Rubrobacteraceae bacterium]
MIQEKTVVPLEALKESRAYRSGWHDGRFGVGETFTENPRLSEWADVERLAYYRGHREGRRIRGMLKEGVSSV